MFGGDGGGGGGFYDSGSNTGGGFVASGGDSGGTFNSPSGGMGASPGGSGRSRGGKRKDRESQTILPVTIKQVLEATLGHDNDFFIDGQEVHHVVVIGCVVSVKAQSTHVQYVVEDGTGRVNIKKWVDDEEDEEVAAKRGDVEEGKYAKFAGQIKDFKDSRMLTAYHVSKVRDMNNMTKHMLEAIYTSLRAKHAEENKQAPQAMASGMMMMQGGAGQAIDMQAGAGDAGVDKVQQVILDGFKNGSFANSGDSGTSMQDIIEFTTSKGIAADQARKAVGFLNDEGHLYTTVDENHFQHTG